MTAAKAHGVIALIALFTSANYLPSKFLLSELNPMSLVTWRLLVAAVFVALFLNRETRALTKRELMLGTISGTFFAAGLLPLFLSLRLSNSGITAFLIGSSILMVPFLEYLALSRRPTRNQILGLLVGTIGMSALCLTSNLTFDVGGGFGLLSAFIFSAWAVSLCFFGREIRAIPLGLAQTYGAAVLFLVLTVLLREFVIPRSSSAWMALLYLGVISGAIRLIVQTWAMQHTTATATEIIFLIEPCAALLWGYLWAHEVPTPLQLGGCFIIIVGILLSQARPPLRPLSQTTHV